MCRIMSNAIKIKKISKYWRNHIDGMSHETCARMLRFGSNGHQIFRSENYDYFVNHFKKLGGMTPEMSKRIGFNK